MSAAEQAELDGRGARADRLEAGRAYTAIGPLGHPKNGTAGIRVLEDLGDRVRVEHVPGTAKLLGDVVLQSAARYWRLEA